MEPSSTDRNSASITAMFFTQLLPSSAHPIRPQLRQLIYSALVD